MAKNKAKDAIDEARAAFRAKDYARSLERYVWFFDHALDGGAASFYGVRLSYCLHEWARLGKVYPEALRQLEAKAEASLALLAETRDPERFHDFAAISEHLGREDEVFRRFLDMHAADPELAGSVIRFVWHDLIEAGHVRVCAAYLGDPAERYGRAVDELQESLAFFKGKRSPRDEPMEAMCEKWFVRDVSNVLAVLRGAGRHAEAAMIEARLAADMKKQGQDALVERVAQRLAQSKPLPG